MEQNFNSFYLRMEWVKLARATDLTEADKPKVITSTLQVFADNDAAGRTQSNHYPHSHDAFDFFPIRMRAK